MASAILAPYFIVAIISVGVNASVPSQTDFDGTYFKTNTLPISLTGNLTDWQQLGTNSFSSHWVDSGTSDSTLAGTASAATVRIATNALSPDYDLRNGGWSVLPVPTFRPSNSGLGIAVDTMPNDSTGAQHDTWIDILSADVIHDSANYEALNLRKYATGDGIISMTAAGTNTLIPHYLLMYPSGKVGFGVGQPYASGSYLHVGGNNTITTEAGAITISTGTNGAPEMIFGVAAAAGAGVGYIQTGARGSAWTKHLVLQPNGANVGIATNTPSEKLEVLGNIKASGQVIAPSFQEVMGVISHAGTSTLDFSPGANANKLVLTGAVTIAFSNLETNRYYHLMVANAQATNCSYVLPTVTFMGYYPTNIVAGKTAEWFFKVDPQTNSIVYAKYVEQQ